MSFPPKKCLMLFIAFIFLSMSLAAGKDDKTTYVGTVIAHLGEKKPVNNSGPRDVFSTGSSSSGASNPFSGVFQALRDSQNKSDRALRAAIARLKPPEGNPFAASEAAEEKKRAQELALREKRQEEEAPLIAQRSQAREQRLAQLQQDLANARFRLEAAREERQAQEEQRRQTAKAEKRAERREIRRYDRSAGYSQEDLERYERNITRVIFEEEDARRSAASIGGLYQRLQSHEIKGWREKALALRNHFLNEEGLVKDWVRHSAIATNMHFLTPESEEEGVELRVQANLALKVHELNYASVEQARVQDAQLAEQALLILSQADQYYAAALRKDAETERNRELARRYFQRTDRLLRSFTPSDPLYSPGFRPMDTGIYVEFGLQNLDNRDFRQLEILVVAHLLHRDSHMSQAILEDEALRFHTAIAFQGAKEAAKANEMRELYTQVDRLYNVLDYMSGAVAGLWDGVKDSAVGLAELVFHPVDSARALANSVIHFDKTFAIIAACIQEMWDTYDELDEHERGHLHGRIAGEILAALAPIGAVGKLGTLAKVTKGVEKVVKSSSFYFRKFSSRTPAKFTYNMIDNPGPLANCSGLKLSEMPAGNFAGGKYNEILLEQDLVLYRAGKAGGGQNAWGQWFTRKPIVSEAEGRIDLAIKRYWLDGKGAYQGQSPLETTYAIHIPAGTIIYEGPVGTQSGIHIGNQTIQQIYIHKPWQLADAKVISQTTIGKY